MADLLKDLDFFNLDDLLTTEERATRETVKRFVQREVLPHVERHFASETFAVELIPQMAELGMFGANIKGYGCAGMNNVAYGLIMQELEAGDSGLRSFASVQSSSRCMQFMQMVPRNRRSATYQRWPKAVSSDASA